ncbi:MAG TPA: peptide chain release factor N(5)-glutamine methyltransferase [Propionibacteriaceae bacterium]|nr:peptide chain release factor N(5)-glutamine methyltransferase [Propionibacteriaceae bacterium]
MPLAASAAVRRAAQALAASRSASPEAEARTLVAHVAGIEPGRIALADPLDDEALGRLDEAVARRVAGEPVQHITGVAHFRTTSLRVGPGVFVPRPETETMAGWCLEQVTPGSRVVELCAGSGAISKALALEGPGLEQWALELSPDAVPYLAANLAGTGVHVVEADMADGLHELDGTVDLVVVNPPYVPLDAWESVPADVRDHDPQLAVFSGADGLDALRVLAGVAARLLRPGGLLAAEHAEVQHDDVVDLYARDGRYGTVRDHRDLVGRWRFLTARRLS